jgi:GXWXG protein/Domain of unknown function (DUF4334)
MAHAGRDGPCPPADLEPASVCPAAMTSSATAPSRAAATGAQALASGVAGKVLARTAAALDQFDRAAPVSLEESVGRWRGSGYPTGHPFDGLLEAYGWYGKEILSPETVHPLLFTDRAGAPRPVNPGLAPFALVRRASLLGRLPGARTTFAVVMPLLSTRRAAARLRLLEHRGTLTAALIYDALPIIDVLRRVDQDTLLGLMDMRGVTQPLFFLLRGEHPRSGSRPEPE